MNLISTQDFHRCNRFEVVFSDNSHMTQELCDILRYSCHKVEEMAADVLKFTSHDFEKNKEYTFLNHFVKKGDSKNDSKGDLNKVTIICYDSAGAIYETLNIAGICATRPNIEFDWLDGKEKRNLVMYVLNVIVKSNRV